MTLPRQDLLAPKRVIGTIAQNPSIQQNTSPDPTQADPLIAKGLEPEQYIGISAIAVGLILLVGFFSRRIEHALIFAVFVSIILIAFFLIV